MIGAINAHTADDIMISGVSLHQNNILQFLFIGGCSARVRDGQGVGVGPLMPGAVSGGRVDLGHARVDREAAGRLVMALRVVGVEVHLGHVARSFIPLAVIAAGLGLPGVREPGVLALVG